MTAPLLATTTIYFLAVARTGSITEAAEFLNVAPSAVSRQVTKLEAALGTVLFERLARGMRLTPEGERLADWANASMVDAEQAMLDIRSRLKQRHDHLRLACTEGLAASFVPRVMALCRAAYPEVTLHLRVGTSSEVSSWLLASEVDLGLKFALSGEAGLTTEFFAEAPIIAAVSPRHPIAQNRHLRLKDLLAQPIAIPGVDTSIHQALDRSCKRHGLRYEAAYTGNLSALTWLAICNEMPMLASHMAVADAVLEGKLKAVPIADIDFECRQMYLLSQPECPPLGVARCFVDQARTVYLNSFSGLRGAQRLS
jgi:DNA-binding transcriptional LysR family regulator